MICRIFLWKFIHEVKSIITFEFSDNYSGIQQNSTCNVKSAQKRKMHVELAILHLQQFLSHNSFSECFTEKKNRQHFHHPTAYYYSGEGKSRWYASAIRIDYVARLYRPRIVEYRRSKCLATRNWWVQFGLSQTATFVSKRPGFVNIFGKNSLLVVYPEPCCSIPTALAPFSVGVRRMMMQNVVCFSF